MDFENLRLRADAYNRAKNRQIKAVALAFFVALLLGIADKLLLGGLILFAVITLALFINSIYFVCVTSSQQVYSGEYRMPLLIRLAALTICTDVAVSLFFMLVNWPSALFCSGITILLMSIVVLKFFDRRCTELSQALHAQK